MEAVFGIGRLSASGISAQSEAVLAPGWISLYGVDGMYSVINSSSDISRNFDNSVFISATDYLRACELHFKQPILLLTEYGSNLKNNMCPRQVTALTTNEVYKTKSSRVQIFYTQT